MTVAASFDGGLLRPTNSEKRSNKRLAEKKFGQCDRLIDFLLLSGRFRQTSTQVWRRGPCSCRHSLRTFVISDRD